MNDLICINARHGQMLHFKNDNTIGLSLQTYGEWAEEEIWLLSHFISQGDYVIDVGANVGCHTLAFSRFVGENGKVIAIDAQQSIFKILATNVVINERKNIWCINSLASFDTKVEYIDAPDSFSGNYGAVSFLGKTQNCGGGSKIPILSLSLDSLELDKCALIKIDVEGMEFDVLMGARKLFQTCRPIVYFEQTSEMRLKEAVDLLKEQYNYRLFYHSANPYNVNNIKGIKDKNIFGGACEVNILAIPKEKSDLFISFNIELKEIFDGDYNPTFPLNALNGWDLPSDSYINLPPVLQKICDFSVYESLASDRITAQQIMEFQLDKIKQLELKVKGE